MTIILFSFLCLAIIYFTVTFFLMNLIKVNHYGTEDLVAMRSEFKDSNVVEVYEKALLIDPNSVDKRRQLIKNYFFNHPDMVGSKLVREHIVWFIRNKPEFEGEWFEWAIHFVISDSEEKKTIIDLFKKIVNEKKSNLNVLKNAAIFFTSLDPVFSAECWETLRSHHPRDPFILDRFASLLSLSPISVNGCGDAKVKSFELFNLLLNVPWSGDDYSRLQKIREKVRFFYPRVVIKILLYARSIFNWKPAWKDYYTVMQATVVAFELKEYKIAFEWGKQLKTLVEIELNKSKAPLNLMAFAILARIELKKNDLMSAKYYLSKITEVKSNLDQDYLSIDEPILKDLIKADNKSTAIEFSKSRLENSSHSDSVKAKIESLLI